MLLSFKTTNASIRRKTVGGLPTFQRSWECELFCFVLLVFISYFSFFTPTKQSMASDTAWLILCILQQCVSVALVARQTETNILLKSQWALLYFLQLTHEKSQQLDNKTSNAGCSKSFLYHSQLSIRRMCGSVWPGLFSSGMWTRHIKSLLKYTWQW